MGKRLIQYIGLFAVTTASFAAPMAPFQQIMREREQQFRGRVLASPEPRRVPYLSLDFEKSDSWQLTHTDQNIGELQVEKGVLRFRMDAESVVLGWGNYSAGAQKGAPTIGWKEGAYMEVRVRQDQPSGKPWDAQFRHHGSHDTGTLRFPMHWSGRHGHFQIPVTEQSAKAGEWVTVRRFVLQVVGADGLALTVTGKKGSVVEIDSVRVVKEDYRVWARKTFELPEAVHSAIATTSVCQDLWVNGQKAYARRRTLYGSWYYFTTVDLKPYLKPGRNVIAIYDPMDMPKTLSTWMQVTVSTISGKVFPIQTDRTWKTAEQQEDGWQKVAFDDRHWKPTGDDDPSGYRKPGEPRIPVLLYDKFRIPAYSGPILMNNPDGPRLFYTETKPVRFELALPAKMTPPEIRYRISNEETAEQTRAGTARLVGKTGEAHRRTADENLPPLISPQLSRSAGRGEGTSESAARLTYLIEAGHLHGGLYSLSLEAEGDPPLARCEPFIVTRKIPMKEVEGSSWDEGCKLTLVDQVDCTAPADPHPFEGPGALDPKFATRVVERHGLRYRESVAEKDWRNLHSWFSWRVQFRHVDRPHWVVVDYPDDDSRCFECEIRPYYENRNKAERDTTSWTSAGVVTGGRYPVTYTMRQLRILVWPQAKDAMVSVMKTFFSLGNVAAGVTRESR